ncbi:MULTISPECIES: glutaredoxin family protein [unclassified Diaminobutyricimonas]|uniref:glutaredoxin family protein n=1 Tax=unclassified Diaminobutyricimonas TaxID=2643261 RepID=UPI0012F5028A|nr:MULTISPECIES: glutaredoxin family protein [unclassified Diaminobutyricimonas]
MPPTRLTLVGKPGCHLCDDARAVVQSVLTDFDDVAFEELSILEHEDLHAKYVEEIPVVLINDKVHNIWRVNPDRLRKALEEASE